jgi:hypothetical protein
MVQCRAARYTCTRFHNTRSVTNMLTELKWPQLQLRRTRTRLIFFYKIIHHLVAIYPTNLLVPSDSRTQQYTHSHSYRHIHTSLDSYKYSFYNVSENHCTVEPAPSCCCTMSHTWQLQRTDTTICSPTTHERHHSFFSYPTHAWHIIVNKMTACGNWKKKKKAYNVTLQKCNQ